MLINNDYSQKYKKAMGAYFSTQAEIWTDYYKHDDAGGMLKQEVVKRRDTVLYLLDKHTPPGPLDILDIGCGAGMLMKDMLERGHRVMGMDISLEMVKQTQKNTAHFPADQKKIFQGDMENKSFQGGTFDCITCVGVLEYQEDDRKSLTEICRVLKTGGLLLLTLPNLLRIRNLLDPYYYMVLLPKLVRKMYRKARPGSIDIVEAFKQNKTFTNKKYLYGRAKGSFDSCGLELRECICIGYWPPTIWRKNLLPREGAIKVSNYIENWPEGRNLPFFNWLANRWVFCLQKGVK